MPRTSPLVTLPGEEAYGRFLDRLLAEAKKRGHTTDSRTRVVELACNLLGLQWGIRAPRRVKRSRHDSEATTEEPPAEV